jgi:DNA repair photolyase
MKNENGNMYEWVSGTKNPLAGECPHGCTYCSTHALKKRYAACQTKYSGPIRLEEKVLSVSPGKHKKLFIVGQNDLFAKEVPAEFISRILAWCRTAENTYLFQTKNPARYFEFKNEFPVDTILCTTIETNRSYPQMGKTPHTLDRAMIMNELVHEGFKSYVTIEPIMDFDLYDLSYLIETALPTQVNIGADSKGHKLPEPSKKKLIVLIEDLKQFTVIDRKTNLERLLR